MAPGCGETSSGYRRYIAISSSSGCLYGRCSEKGTRQAGRHNRGISALVRPGDAHAKGRSKSGSRKWPHFFLGSWFHRWTGYREQSCRAPSRGRCDTTAESHEMCCAKFCDARGSEQRHPSRILPSQQEVVAIEVINSNVDAVQDCPPRLASETLSGDEYAGEAPTDDHC